MRIKDQSIGPWRTVRYDRAHQTKAERFAVQWILDHLSEYKAHQLDHLIRNAKDALEGSYASGTLKETVGISKEVGATLMWSNAVDHYRLVGRRNSDGRVFFAVSEPIGFDLNRHKLQP